VRPIVENNVEELEDPPWAETQPMRLGLFGGTFDPIHVGHLILAESCREACRLDRVWFVVAGAPPHKAGPRTAVADRLEMVRIAIAGHPAFEVSELETSRPGPHYSVETLEEVHRRRPDDEIFFLIGADSLVDLPRWRQPERIAALATVVVVSRPSTTTAQPITPFRPEFGAAARPMQMVEIPLIGIASNDLRRRIAEGRSIRYQVPRGVEAYIHAHRLYQQ
jgi:nicotinate-nucleotide adenylyltransferase